jgi:hypothetical protein
MPDTHHVDTVEVVDRPISISHFVHILHAYMPIVILATVAIAIAYIVLAIGIYVFSPSQNVTTQQFRLDFEGASTGHYPNGLKFSTSDIVSTPILLAVFNENHLERFTKFPTFSRSIFVLEANPEYELLAASYAARLSDPRITAVDRERIQREWEAKAAAISKSDYSINWLRSAETASVPESVVRKSLVDTLTLWAKTAATEQHVLMYRLSILSPDVVDGGDVGTAEPVVAIQVLRSKIYRIIGNIDALKEVPGSELLRSHDGVSLDESRLRLEEIVRFRLEPMVARLMSTGLVVDRPFTLRFLESQLAFDNRELKAKQDAAEAIKQSLAVYSLDQRALTGEPSAAAVESRTSPRAGDTVMPQISDSFIDRLVALTSQANDIEYRQKAVDNYRRAALAIVPSEQTVTYDQELLTLIKNTPSGTAPSQAAAIHNEIELTKSDVRLLVVRINEIYAAVSRHLNPSTELYTLVAPPVTRTEHSRSLPQLALYGTVVVAVALPLIVILCLLHARMRDEEADQEGLAAAQSEALST